MRGGGGDRRTFVHIWAWGKGIERGEREGVEMKGKEVGLGARYMVPWSQQTLDWAGVIGGADVMGGGDLRIRLLRSLRSTSYVKSGLKIVYATTQS